MSEKNETDQNKLSRLPPKWIIPAASLVLTLLVLLPEDLRSIIFIPSGLMSILTGIPVGWFWLLTAALIWATLGFSFHYVVHHDGSDELED